MIFFDHYIFCLHAPSGSRYGPRMINWKLIDSEMELTKQGQVLESAGLSPKAEFLDFLTDKHFKWIANNNKHSPHKSLVAKAKHIILRAQAKWHWTLYSKVYTIRITYFKQGNQCIYKKICYCIRILPSLIRMVKKSYEYVHKSLGGDNYALYILLTRFTRTKSYHAVKQYFVRPLSKFPAPNPNSSVNTPA